MNRQNTFSLKIVQYFSLHFAVKIIIKCLLKDLILNPLQLRLGRNILQNFLIGATVLWIYIYKSSKDNKRREFSFKVMHRIIPTKKELMKYKLASDDKCPLCLNPGSIEHTYIVKNQLISLHKH